MSLSDFAFIIEKIQAGSLGVLPTDTIYGIIATAGRPDVVERVYRIKNRPDDKPFIILISDVTQLDKFGVSLNEAQTKSLQQIWPGPTSVILSCPAEEFAYLHRGRHSLAFRVPHLNWLRELVAATGPIVATSANKAGAPTSSNLAEIMRQLPDLDFYIEGPVSNTPSRLVKLADDGSAKLLERSGSG